MKKIFCLISVLFFLAACGDNGTSANESSMEKSVALDIRVDSWSMLPNCTETRDGEYAFVTKTPGEYRDERDTYSVYRCDDGEWVLHSRNVVSSLDDLLSSCRAWHGSLVMVLSEEAFYRCDREEDKWIKLMDFPKDLQKSSFSDSRDGQTYKTVKIGDQVWMAENLNYKTDGSFCFNDSAEYCAKYGRLYSWDAAMNACPNGWHLPDTNEFAKLVETVSGGYFYLNMLAFGDSAYFGPAYSDLFGFSWLPAGIWRKGGDGTYAGGDNYDDAFYYDKGVFWSSTEAGNNYAYFFPRGQAEDSDGYYLAMAKGDSQYGCFGTYCKSSRNSVRCVKD